MSSLKVLWHWSSMGPYHFARMSALARIPQIQLTVVESAGADSHCWVRQEEANGFNLHTLSRYALSKRILKESKQGLFRALNETRPDVVVAAGYTEAHSLHATLAYRASNPASVVLLWSESTAADSPRRRPIEALKSLILRAFDGALVAGKAHVEYLVSLGVPPEAIGAVGNCVDNEFFAKRAAAVRAEQSATGTISSADYFLFVGRLIPEKNLSRLIEAYREYRIGARQAAWDLVLVGSGPEEGALKQQVVKRNVEGIHFVGLCQLQELPSYYARSKCFILPSTSEPWGLVVNEAMASALPVLVSHRCGSVPDLVEHGVNGFVFDPWDTHGLAGLLARVSGRGALLQELGRNAQDKIGRYSPDRFAERAATHIHSVYEDGVRKYGGRRLDGKTERLLRAGVHLGAYLSGLVT